MATMRKKKMDRVISLQDWTAGEYINLPGCFGALFDVLAVQIFLRKTEGFPDLPSIAVRSKVKAGLGSHLLLRRVGRIRVHFAGNGLPRFGCFSGAEFFISSATAKGNNSASKENKTPVFHREINNQRVLDFQRR